MKNKLKIIPHLLLNQIPYWYVLTNDKNPEEYYGVSIYLDDTNENKIFITTFGPSIPLVIFISKNNVVNHKGYLAGNNKYVITDIVDYLLDNIK